MTFTLTESLLNQIQSALENQEKQFLVDAAKSELVEKTDGLKNGIRPRVLNCVKILSSDLILH